MIESDKPRTPSLFLIASATIAIWVLSWSLIHFFYGKADSAGAFGDQFGAVNAMFSGLALSGIIYAIILQRHDLKVQSKELALSRREFIINRSLTATYKQVELLDKRLESLMIYSYYYDQEEDNQVKVKTQIALKDLNENMTRAKLNQWNFNKDHHELVFEFLENNQEDLQHIIRWTYSSFLIIEALVNDREITSDDRRLIKRAFFYNIDEYVWDFISQYLNMINVDHKKKDVEEYKFWPVDHDLKDDLESILKMLHELDR